jgi:hypothetical protein
VYYEPVLFQVWVATSFSALRSIVAMLVLDTHAAVKILWVMLHFLLFVTAITVVILGLTFTNSASGVNIRRSLLISIPLGAAWSICQAVLEFKLEPPVRAASDITNSSQHSPESTSSEAYFLYGGLEFMLSESGFFVLVYCVPFVCVCTSRLHKLQLPARTSFYVYCLLLGLCHTGQCIGLALILAHHSHRQITTGCGDLSIGYCVMDFTSFIYYSLLVPTIYCIFLHPHFRKPAQPQADLTKQLYEDGTSMTENSPLLQSNKQSAAKIVGGHRRRWRTVDQSVAEECFGHVPGSLNGDADDLLESLSSLSSLAADEKLDVKLSSSIPDID